MIKATIFCTNNKDYKEQEIGTSLSVHREYILARDTWPVVYLYYSLVVYKIEDNILKQCKSPVHTHWEYQILQYQDPDLRIATSLQYRLAAETTPPNLKSTKTDNIKISMVNLYPSKFQAKQ